MNAVNSVNDHKKAEDLDLLHGHISSGDQTSDQEDRIERQRSGSNHGEVTRQFRHSIWFGVSA